MKKCLFLIGLVFLFSKAYSAPVDSLKLSQLVDGFIYQNYTGISDLTIKSIQSLTLSNDTIGLSVVNLSPKGWIIVSNNDAVQPVYGYNFDQNFDRSRLSNDQGMLYVFDSYNNLIKESLRTNSTILNPGWDLSKAKLRSTSTITDVQPLISISWNQDKGWNLYCPADAVGPDGHVYVGCVAVAMAQAMTVKKYPSKGVGIKTYVDAKYGRQTVNFDTYGAFNWANIVDGTNTSNADIASLLYQCAVTVEMMFGNDGSGAYVTSVAPAMKSYFSYSKSVTALNRVETDAEWISILNNELVNGRPVVYGGDADNGKAGHAFNIDGVASNGFYHLNWGWSGANNGYFSISNLKPGSFDFTKNQSAIIGIKPITPGPIDISLSSTTVQENMPVGSVVGTILVEDDYAANTYTFTVAGTYNVFDEMNPVYFLQEGGVLKTTKVFTYVSGKANKENMIVTVKDKYGKALSKTLSIDILKNTSALPVVEIKPEDRIYYNSQTENIEIGPSVVAKNIQIISLTGIDVYHSVPQSQVIDLSGLQAGVYIAILKTSTGIVRLKFLKE